MLSYGARNYAIHCDAMFKFNIADIYLLDIIQKYPYWLYEWQLLKQLESYDDGRIIWKEPCCASVG